MHTRGRPSGRLLFLCHFVDRARDNYKIATADAGSVKEIPDQFIVLKGAHNVEYLRATRTDVSGS
jgi:hypothetical protein